MTKIKNINILLSINNKTNAEELVSTVKEVIRRLKEEDIIENCTVKGVTVDFNGKGEN